MVLTKPQDSNLKTNTEKTNTETHHADIKNGWIFYKNPSALTEKGCF